METLRDSLSESSKVCKNHVPSVVRYYGDVYKYAITPSSIIKMFDGKPF